MSAFRAENRRAAKAAQKADDYKESGFVDRAIYTPFVATQRTDRRGFDGNGNPLPSGPFTASELHQRAVARRDNRKMLEKLTAEQEDAAKEGRATRKAEVKQSRRLAYLLACTQSQPVKYMHSAARRRLAAVPTALAA